MLRLAGWLQFLELAAFDQFIRLRPYQENDPPIVIVGLTEADIQELKQTIISDQTLAQLITKIKQQKPLAIGLDIYRDLPEEPGYQQLVKVFETTPNLIGIQKIVGNNDVPINPPPVLAKLNQVAAADVIVDADGKLRRFFLYLNTEDNQLIPSLGLKLAKIYLKNQGIKPKLTQEDYLQLGKAVFVPFASNDGGYIRAEDGAYQMILNYQPVKFPVISVTEVLNGKINPQLMTNKLVLIGNLAYSKQDIFLTPYSTNLIGTSNPDFGVKIHGYITNQIIDAALGKQSLIQTWSEGLEYSWIGLWALLGTIIVWKSRYTTALRKISGKLVFSLLGLVFALVSICYLAWLQGWWLPVVPPLLAIGGATMTIISYIAYKAADLRSLFSRYLSDEVVANLLETPQAVNLGGERRKVTILMTDLRGFSIISENLPPEELVNLLNIYLEKMTEIIMEYQGIIDEFIGDAILVYFGAPTQRNDDSERAVACAVAMQLAMSSVNEQLSQLQLPKIEMGIGINTGEVVVGNIGSSRRTKWTVIGSQINLASRIESYTIGGQILISGSTLQEIGKIVKIAQQRTVHPKGFKDAIAIYEVQGISGNYNLFLPDITEDLVELKQPIAIAYTIITDKEISQDIFSGNVVKVSLNSAEITCQFAIPILQNIQIEIVDNLEKKSQIGYIYAKVTRNVPEKPLNYVIYFTAINSQFEEMLSKLSRI